MQPEPEKGRRVIPLLVWVLLLFSLVSVLAHWPLCRRAVAFVPLLTSLSLTKSGITNSQILQGEKVFPVISRSESLGDLSLEHARDLSEISLNYNWVRIGIGRLDDVYLGILEIKASPAQ